MTVRPAHMRSPELARWLHQHGLVGCTCTWLPTGTANWYLYRVLDDCPCDHPDASPSGQMRG